MVTTDISQLTGECNTWRENLRNYRQEFTDLKNKLQSVAPRLTAKDMWKDVEHYHNQFHIQLINIHDLKHAIKDHTRQAEMEMADNDGHINETTWATHEDLLGQYNQLDQTLNELKQDFNQFTAKLN